MFNKLAIFLSTTAVTLATLKYTWFEFNDYYDSVVGIAVDGVPTGCGAFLTRRILITAANPFEAVAKHPERVKLYGINGAYDKTKAITVQRITGNQQKRLTSDVWVNVGFDKLHSTVHDLITMTIKHTDLIKIQKGTRLLNYGAPIHLFLHFKPSHPRIYYEATGWSYASFGFVDPIHVEENLHLEVAEYFETPVLVDCDEWIPREWGHFICLTNIENFTCIGSGTPLFYNNLVAGFGSFELTKGNESILVFTDLQNYGIKGLHFDYVKPESDYY